MPAGDQIRYPEMRQRLRMAVHSLCDEDFQRRLWGAGERHTADELGFADTLLVVVDELERFTPDIVGDVLLDEDERCSFDALADAIIRVIDRVGKRGGYAEAVETPGWGEVKEAARYLEPLLAR